jgi:A/G-specific adenine glycosylase
MAGSLADDLLDWYGRSARCLPWRLPPGSRARPDPYGVWLAEVMLQQTTVVTAAPYWQRFLARWPTVQALAAADEAEVLREWAGLGYYARARNLLATARIVAETGCFPETEPGLRALPGIGPYTAAAIAAIAFDQPCVALDGNVERVAARLFDIAEPLPAARERLRASLRPLLPLSSTGDFAQALMDLGATICTPRAPRCPACPLVRHCAAHAAGTAERLPVKRPRPARQIRHGTAWWIESGGAVALVRRPARGLLGGMPALPGTDWKEKPSLGHPFASGWSRLPRHLVHGFTHFELRLTIEQTCIADRLAQISGQPVSWVPIGRLGEAGLPTLYARAVELVRDNGKDCTE